MSIRDNDGAIGAAVAMGASAAFQRGLDNAVENAGKALQEAMKHRNRAPVQSAQGFFAEQWHANTFNIDAYKQGARNLWAEALASNKLGSDDIAIYDGQKSVLTAQSKYYGNAHGTTNELSQKAYDHVNTKLAPSDQIDKIREISAGRATTAATEQARQSAGHTAETVSDRLHARGVESKPLSRAESESRTERTRAGEDVLADMRGLLPREIASKAATGGAVAAGIGFALGVAPTVLEAIRVWREGQRLGDPEFDALLRKGLLDGGRNALRSGLQGAISTALVHAAAAGHFGQLLADIGPGPIGAISVVILQAISDGAALYRGEIDSAEFAWRTATTATVSAGSLAGAALGQLVIPIPFLGAMIGSAVGGLVARVGIEWTREKLRAGLDTAMDRMGEVLFGWDLIAEARVQSAAFEATLLELDAAFVELRKVEVQVFAALSLPPINLEKLAQESHAMEDQLQQFEAEWATLKGNALNV